MARRLRVAAGGIVYHVLNRAVGRVRIFRKEGDYMAFEKALRQAHERTGTRLLAYCLMPNHWHLVLWPREDGELSQYVRWLSVTHTQRWHGRQAEVVNSLEPKMATNYPTLEQAAFVCSGYPQAQSFIIERDTPHERISGWFITCDDPNDAHEVADLRATSLYQVSLHSPLIASFLALPPGCAGHIGPPETELYRGDCKLTIVTGSFLSRLAHGDVTRDLTPNVGTAGVLNP